MKNLNPFLLASTSLVRL